MTIEDFIIVRAQQEGSGAGFLRRDIQVGDLVRRKNRTAPGGWRLVASMRQMNDFYRALGIELWGEWRWS
jgi:hypothetical protein